MRPKRTRLPKEWFYPKCGVLPIVIVFVNEYLYSATQNQRSSQPGQRAGKERGFQALVSLSVCLCVSVCVSLPPSLPPYIHTSLPPYLLTSLPPMSKFNPSVPPMSN